MKHRFFLVVLFFAALVLPASAADKIEDFLGLKFGATQAAAKQAMLARGSKLKDEKTPDTLTFAEGTYSGQRITELALHFSEDRFYTATVTVKFSTGKSNEKGLAMYDTIRKSLADKYGPPTSAPSVARSKSFMEKAKGNQLETIWQTKDVLIKENRSIVLQVPEMGMYDWLFKVTYQDHNVTAKRSPNLPRKDI